MKKTIIPMLLLAVLIFSTTPPKYTFEETDAIKVFNQLQTILRLISNLSDEPLSKEDFLSLKPSL